MNEKVYRTLTELSRKQHYIRRNRSFIQTVFWCMLATGSIGMTASVYSSFLWIISSGFAGYFGGESAAMAWGSHVSAKQAQQDLNKYHDENSTSKL